MSQGIRRINHRIQHLIVPGRGETEFGSDSLLFGTDVLPPLPLEFQDGSVALGQLFIAVRR